MEMKTEEEAIKQFEAIDTNHNGSLGFGEFS